MDRFVLISADCHAVGRPDDFRPFIESQYLDAFDEENRKRIELAREARKASEDGGLLFSREALEEYQSHDGHRGRRPRWHRGAVGLRPSHPGARGRRRRRRGRVPERRPVRHRSRRRARAAASCASPACARTTAGSPTSARRHRAVAPGSRSCRSTTSTLSIAEIERAAARGAQGSVGAAAVRRPGRAAALPRAVRADVGGVRGEPAAGARARRRRPRLRRRHRHAHAHHALRHRGAAVAAADVLLPALERRARTAPRPATRVHRGHVRLGADRRELPRLPLRVEGLRAHPSGAPEAAE